VHHLIPDSDLDSSDSSSLSPLRLAQLVEPSLTLDRLNPILCPRASQLIMAYDEHLINNCFKFGLIYQKVGQITEEQMFGNRTHSPAMEEFMEMLGQKINLSEHRGYR
jgi:RAP1 GTPase activating protein 1